MLDGPWQSCMLVRGLNPGECASWVQAWGAVLAIVASSVLVLLVQRAEARRVRIAKEDEEARFLKIVGQFVFDARAKLRDIEDHELPHLHRNWKAVEAPIACIRGVPFDRYPAESAAFAVAAALISYDFMRDEYSGLDGKAGTLDEVGDIGELRRQTIAGFFRAEQEIHAALVARRSKLPLLEMDFGNGVFIRTLNPDPV